jgi:hypothetical protein
MNRGRHYVQCGRHSPVVAPVGANLIVGHGDRIRLCGRDLLYRFAIYLSAFAYKTV